MANAYGPLKIGNGNRVACFGNSIGSQSFVPYAGHYDPQWNPSVSVSLGDYIFPCYHDMTVCYENVRYKCTKAGTTGLVEPLWDDSIGSITVDGSAEFTCELSTYIPSTGGGYWTIAQAMSGQRLDEVFVCGASGKMSDYILPYVERVDSSNVDIYYFGPMFENDVVNITPSALATNWSEFIVKVNSLRRLGKRIILQTCLPSGSIDATGGAFNNYSSANGTLNYNWINKQIREFCKSKPDVYLFDIAYLYIDPNYANPVWPENTSTFVSVSGTGQALKYTDGVHPNGAASWAIGKYVASRLAELFPKVEHFQPKGDSQYLANPLKFGSDGAKNGNMSGTVADLYTINLNTTGSGVASKVTRDDSVGEWQRVAYTLTVGENLSCFETIPRAEDIESGDVIQVFSEIRVITPHNGISQIYGFTRIETDFGNKDLRQTIDPTSDYVQSSGQFIVAGTTLTMKSVKIKTPAGYQTIRNFAVVGNAVAGSSATIDFGRHALIKLS